MGIKKIDDQELAAALATLPRWRVVAGKLHREFDFPDFNAAFGFMTRAALAAERADHHPEWSNAYGKVTVDLVTHAIGALSHRDIDLARALDRLAAER